MGWLRKGRWKQGICEGCFGFDTGGKTEKGDKVFFLSQTSGLQKFRGMKSILACCAALVAVSSVARAQSPAAGGGFSLVLKGVHNCCKKCETGIENAVSKVDGTEAKTEKNKVTISAKDEATARKAVDALLKDGYYGEGAHAPAVADEKVKTAVISGLHLCCGKCVTAVDSALKSVAGVSKHNAVKGSSDVTVEGDFSTKALSDALHKAGFHGGIR